MPWAPELFSAPALERVEEMRQQPLATVPFFDGVMLGEAAALIESYAGEPRLQHPLAGQVHGVKAFEAFVVETKEWLDRHGAEFEEVERHKTAGGGFEEVLVHTDTDRGRLPIPHSVVASRVPDGRLAELRVYFCPRPLTGRHERRRPLLPADPSLREPPVLAELRRALAAGDAEAVVATFEADGYVREPPGGRAVHRGPNELRSHYERLLSAGGGIEIELCGIVEADPAWALEYNLVGWGGGGWRPQPGLAVFDLGPEGRIAAARIYDDVGPPRLSQP